MTSSESSAAHRYALRFMPEALAEWHALDGSVRAPLKKLLAKRLDNPHVPGGELHGALASASPAPETACQGPVDRPAQPRPSCLSTKTTRAMALPLSASPAPLLLAAIEDSGEKRSMLRLTCSFRGPEPPP